MSAADWVLVLGANLVSLALMPVVLWALSRRRG